MSSVPFFHLERLKRAYTSHPFLIINIEVEYIYKDIVLESKGLYNRLLAYNLVDTKVGINIYN